MTIQRRMAMARAALNREARRPLSDREQLELLKHDVDRLHREDTLIARGVQYIDALMREAQEDLLVKRRQLQASWARLQYLERERRQILAEQAAADAERSRR
jgi:hypothetical protein